MQWWTGWFRACPYAAKEEIAGMSASFSVNPGWRVTLADAGINIQNVLIRAGLAGDLFARERASLTTEQYFRLWRAIDDEARDPLLPLHIGSMVTAEAFDPPLFAAMCSPDLNTALSRISQHKRLIGPVGLHVEIQPGQTKIELEWLDKSVTAPQPLVLAELVFFVQLSRLGTRTQVVPLSVGCPELPTHTAEYADYFGVPVSSADAPTVVFDAADANRPFLTANQAMWQFFEPELRARLSEIKSAASASERVSSALVELLPAGSSSVDSVADKLGTSPRTLQRRLRSEGQSYQGVLNSTRRKLANHYLTNSVMSGSEISFLLGYEHPNSFYRAYQSWTGETPETARRHASV